MDTKDHQTHSNQLQPQFQALMGEKLQLQDKNEQLRTKVGYLEGRVGHLASSNVDLSSRLIQSEEQKLKLSKELVEEKIETNKMRDKFEEEAFELKNKVQSQNRAITDLETEREKLLGELQEVSARLKAGEGASQGLTEEHAALKQNYLALSEAHNEELRQSRELRAEVLTLARAQDALRGQLEEQHQRIQATMQELHEELRDRLRASRKSEELSASDEQEKHEEKALFGYLDAIKEALEKMKTSHEEQHRKLEERVTAALGEKHREGRRGILDDAVLMCSRRQIKEVEEENSSLQLQIKKLNEEYRTQLECYLRDIAEHMDGVRGGPIRSDGGRMRAFVDRMLQDVRSSHRLREEQLASAARSYKKRLQRLTRSHHALLMAYRDQREQILLRPDSGLDPGPPEDHFSPAPTELRHQTETEFYRAGQDDTRPEGPPQVAPEQVALRKDVRFEVH